MIENKIPPVTREYLDEVYRQGFEEYKESPKGQLDSFVYSNFDKIRSYLELCLYLGTQNRHWYEIAIKNSKHYQGMYSKLNWKKQKGYC